MEESREGFVKTEYSAGLAQSEDRKTPEKINLIRQIDGCTRELIEGLRSAENLTENTNKRLLPSTEKPLAKEGKVEQCPNGWFEQHLADLRMCTGKVTKIIGRLQRLVSEIKTDKVGQ